MPMTTAILDQWASGLRALEPADDPAFGSAQEDRTGQSYNQAAFRYFLTLERKRSERAGRPFALLLVDLEKPAGALRPLEPGVASRLFETLRSHLRDTDILGWYQDGHVVGAMLTHDVHFTGTDVQRAIEDRVGRAIRESLQGEDSHRVQIRVLEALASATAAGQSWP